MPRWSTENRTEIAAILAYDRVFRIKGLVTTVTSLQEPDNLYFPHFAQFYLSMLDRYWSKIAGNMPHRCVVGGCSNVRSLEIKKLWQAYTTSAVRKCNFFAFECKMALTSLHDFYGSCHLHICRSLFDHSTFFVASLVFMNGHFVLCYKKEF